MSVLPYRLSISIRLPRIATEGEAFTLSYEVKNIGNTNFPGGMLNVIMNWPALGSALFVGHPLNVGSLLPDETWHSHEFTETPPITGITVFVSANIPFTANDGRAINLYLADGVTLSQNRPIGAVRARSHEEISQKQAVQIAVVSLVIVAIFEIANLIVALLK
jgi:hypothetical protein